MQDIDNIADQVAAAASAHQGRLQGGRQVLGHAGNFIAGTPNTPGGNAGNSVRDILGLLMMGIAPAAMMRGDGGGRNYAQQIEQRLNLPALRNEYWQLLEMLKRAPLPNIRYRIPSRPDLQMMSGEALLDNKIGNLSRERSRLQEVLGRDVGGEIKELFTPSQSKVGLRGNVPVNAPIDTAGQDSMANFNISAIKKAIESLERYPRRK